MAKKKQSLLHKKKGKSLFWGLNPCHQTKDWLYPLKLDRSPLRRDEWQKKERFQCWQIAWNKMGSVLGLFSNDTTKKDKMTAPGSECVWKAAGCDVDGALWFEGQEWLGAARALHQSAIDYHGLVCCSCTTVTVVLQSLQTPLALAQMLSKSG